MLNKELDPVCGMALHPFEALGQSIHGDLVYYFCSQECKQKFDRGPQQYLEKQPVRQPER